jgi:asparagine synthase (glutamine-hydrolysing)
MTTIAGAFAPSGRSETTVAIDGRVTDAVTLAARYEREGGRCLDGLDGQFALAIVSPRSACLARDAWGTKPLHYHVSDDGSRLLFASTAGEIAARLEEPVEIDVSRLADFLIFGRILGNGTLLRGIKTVMPGRALDATIAHGRLVISERQLEAVEPEVTVDTLDAAVDGVAERLRAAVASCVEGERTLGVALSGGLDSSVVALFARELAVEELLTFTLGSAEQGSDGEAARDLAGRLGARHCEVPLTFEAYLRAIPAVMQAREFPTVAGITLVLLTQRMALECGACLTGFGAGDVFGDTNQHCNWEIYRGRLQRKMRRAAALGLPLSEEAEAAFDAAMRAASYAEYFESSGYCDQGVPWIDGCGARNGVEVRVPFCSEGLYTFIRAIPLAIRRGPPPGGDKYLLRCAALKRFGCDASGPVHRAKENMPDTIVGFHRRFVELCDAAVDDRAARRHEFGSLVSDKSMLVLLDLFTAMFRDRRRPDEVDIGEYLGWDHTS